MSAQPGGGPSRLPRAGQRQQPACPAAPSATSSQLRRPSNISATAAAARQRAAPVTRTSIGRYGYGQGGYAGRQQPLPSESAKVVCPRPSSTCPRPADSKSSCPVRPSTSKGSQGSLRPSSAPGRPPCSRVSQKPTSRGSSSGRSRTSVNQSDGKLLKKVTSTVEKRIEQPPCRSRDGSLPPPTLVTTTTTVEEYFESENQPCGSGSASNRKKTEDALAMVKEEDRDVKEVLQYPPPTIKSAEPEDYVLRKNLEQLKVQHDSVMGRESQAKIDLPPPDIPTDEVQPETLAQIMFTEERGIKLDAPPDHLVAHLFPDRDDMVEVSSVAQGTMQDVVVPTAVPPALHSSVLKKDDIHKAIEMVSTVEKPADNIFSQSMGQGTSAPPNSVAAKPKRSGKPAKLLMDTTPPWISIDIEKMHDIIGASPVRKEITKLDTLEETLVPSDTDPNNLEYFLAMEPPRHHSRVQLRGSQKPPWFPGYLIALPDIPESIRVAKSPSAVLAAAWKSVQPKIFEDANISFV